MNDKIKAEKWPRKVTVGAVSAKVYRVKHATAASGWAYVVAIPRPNGRKLQKFADQDAALKEARLQVEQINAGRVEGGDMSRSDRDELQAARAACGDLPLLAALAEWQKCRELTQGNLTAACEAWAARNSTAHEKITVGVAIDRFLDAKRKAGVDVTCSYQKILPTVKGKFGDRPIDTLSATELQNWMEERYPNAVTRNTARKRIVSLWRWSRKKGYLPRDAQTEAEATDSAQEEDGEIGVINTETFGRLLEHFRAEHPEYLAALILAGFQGLRRSEVHGQSWEDIELGRKFVRVTSAKKNTPSRRIVPLSPAAVKWLQLCKNREGLVCDNLAIDRIRDIGRAAGFTLPENCFRHSRISHRVAQTGNVAEVALESGNSPTIIFQHYRELFTKQEGEAWFSIRPKKGATVAAIGGE